jgi:hypothetical protein
MFVDPSFVPLFYWPVVSEIDPTILQDYLLFGEPLRTSTTKYVWETCIWPRIELGYGNNVEDWAIRRLTT